jgi:translation elongation factor EF-4
LAYIKVIDGEIRAGSTLELVHSENTITPNEVGYFTPDYKADKVLSE